MYFIMIWLIAILNKFVNMRLNIILFKNMHTTIGKNVKHAKRKIHFWTRYNAIQICVMSSNFSDHQVNTRKRLKFRALFINVDIIYWIIIMYAKLSKSRS